MNSTTVDPINRKLLEAAYSKINQLKDALRHEKSKTSEAIAIVGFGCRFPGGGNDPQAYWEMLEKGIDAVGEVPSDRWDAEAYYDEDPNVAGKMYSKNGAFLENVDQFDANFFGVSPREAGKLDPQHRLLLETSWEALEHAGVAADRIRGGDGGVFIGQFMADYSQQALYQVRPETIEGYSGLGSLRSMSAGRLSYFLDWHGPSMQVDTACSSSLLSIHLACQSLRTGECSIALAGGVNLMFDPANSVGISRMQAVSPDGRCKSFDAAGDGYGRAEGCGVVVLKRLSQARQDGDRIDGVIYGSAVNHDGRSNGATAPNGKAQEMLIHAALKNAGLSGDEIDYIEAHGTGTQLGDPIELEALVNSLGRDRVKPLLIGAVKSNIGHTESASGVASLIKVVLSLQKGRIPANLHFHNPSPHIPWANLPMQVVTQTTPWDGKERRRLAGINSFGMSGTNVHMIIGDQLPEPSEVRADEERPVSDVLSDASIYTLSAQTPKALHQLIMQHQQWLLQADEVDRLPDPGDICHTLEQGRSRFSWRLALPVFDGDQLIDDLEEVADTLDLEETFQEWGSAAVVARTPQRIPLAGFLFTGQGSQYPGMGSELYQKQPHFREELDRCAELLQQHLDTPLLELLFSNERYQHAADLDITQYTQPALFAFEYALASLWQSWGIEPKWVMGHSVGEYVAACIAGVFSLEDGLKLIAARGRLMEERCNRGSMAAIAAAEDVVNDLLTVHAAGKDLELAVAAVNGPENTVVSGATEQIETFQQYCADQGIRTKILLVSHGFHSVMMKPMLEEFLAIAESVTYHQPEKRLISNVTGAEIGEEVATAQYWMDHIMAAVRFSDGIQTLADAGCELFIEIGAKPTLIGMGQQTLSPEQQKGRYWIPVMRPHLADDSVALHALATLKVLGVEMEQIPQPHLSRQRVILPTYPFQRLRHWINREDIVTTALPSPGGSGVLNSLDASLLDSRVDLGEGGSNHRYVTELELHEGSWLADHRVGEQVIVPASWFIEMVAEGVGELLVEDGGADHQRRVTLLQQQRLTLTDVNIERPLILQPSQLETVQLVLTADEAGEQKGRWKILSHGGAGEWLPHLSGKWQQDALIPGSLEWQQRDWGYRLQGDQPALDCERLLSAFPKQRNAEEHYRYCHDIGLHYGPSFQGVVRFFEGAENEGVAEIQLPQIDSEIEGVNGLSVHPVLLDAALHMSIHVMKSLIGDDTYVPVRIANLRLIRQLEEHFYCYARLVRGSMHERELMACELVAFLPSGELLFHIDELVVKRMPASMVRSDDASEGDRHTLMWKEVNDDNLVDDSEERHWVILSDGSALSSSLAHAVENGIDGGCSVVASQQSEMLTSGKSSTHVVDLSDSAQLVALLGEIDQAQQRSIGIIDLWSARPGLPTRSPGDQEVAESAMFTRTLQHSNIFLSVVQAIEKVSWKQPPAITVVSRGSQIVDSESEGSAVASAGLACSGLPGMVRVAAFERPEMSWGVIDLDHTSKGDEMESQTIVDHLRSGALSERAAIRNGHRFVVRLQPLSAAKKVSNSETTALSIDPDGSYLITGGLGGLGLTVARWLAKEGAQKLLLLGRKAPDDEQRREMGEIAEQYGCNVQERQADISDQVHLRQLFDSAAEAGAPIRGVVHAAGLIDDSMLESMDSERMERVMLPKVAGSWNIHQAMQGREIDFFVVFSSLSAVLGSVGQANYAAGNAFMDALMAFRRSQGLPGLSINWGVWSEVGIVSRMDEKSRKRLNEMGLSPLTPQQGIAHLNALLSMESAPSTVSVIPMAGGEFLHRWQNLSRLLADYPRTSAAKKKSVATDIQAQLEAAVIAERPQILEWFLREEVARTLGIGKARAIDMQQGFAEMGFDSMTSLEFRNRLQLTLSCSLPATLIFDYPTLSDLLDHLASTLPQLAATGRAGQGDEGQEDIAGSAGVDELFSELDSVDDDDLIQQMSEQH